MYLYSVITLFLIHEGHHGSYLGHLMLGPPKHKILERFRACLQAKPDHMGQPLSQLLLDLLLPKVTTPVVIPEETSNHRNHRKFVYQHARINML